MVGGCAIAVAEVLERIYHKYHRPEFIHPDPLEFLYRYENPLDRQVVGLVAACLAYGQMRQILASVEWVLHRIPSPAKFLREATEAKLHDTFDGFRHRFTTGRALAWMLVGVKGAIERYGSLEACFLAGYRAEHETIQPALRRFVAELSGGDYPAEHWILASPEKGSACKRLHLFLRWMVRRDDVDPGGWDGVPTAKLIVPVDTHMHRIALALGLTRRKQADGKCAQEITSAFRVFAPDDPVRYDFALTRVGIRGPGDWDDFLSRQLYD